VVAADSPSQIADGLIPVPQLFLTVHFLYPVQKPSPSPFRTEHDFHFDRLQTRRGGVSKSRLEDCQHLSYKFAGIIQILFLNLKRCHMEFIRRGLLCSLAIFLCLPAFAQSTDINRYTLFTGFDYLISPARDLTERGFEGDFGVTLKPWLGVGGDFSAIGNGIISGAGAINGNETVFAPILKPYIDPGSVNVPFKSTTYTFAVGPQFYIRHWEKITLLVRPGFGGIHESADIAFPAQLAHLFGQLGVSPPNPHQSDTQWFIGIGGGFDLNVSRRVGWRLATDYVNTHLFSNLLVPRQNYWRFSTGPTFRWGHLK
jgi:hypothetical protein